MDSFYTISSDESGRVVRRNQDQEVKRTDIEKNNPALTSPSPATHDTSRATYHISDIAAFAESLQSVR
jgi:hypothetical protein